MYSIILIVFVAASFLYYGASLFGKKMVLEFERFGIVPWKRKLTGVLQLLGASGLIFGLYLPELGVLAATGLFLLMLIGFIVRIKVRDGLLKSLPSFAYMLLNFYIVIYFILQSVENL